MTVRRRVGAGLDSVLGRERTTRLRTVERRWRSRAAAAIAPPARPAPRAQATNPLEAYFESNSGRLIHKWQHYFDIYHRHFRRYRGKPVTVLEFGVFHGGSLHMWRDYFGPQARIIGVDIDPRCAMFIDEGFEIYIGDQEDRFFLRELAAKVGPVDVLIEDGGHYMPQQIATFEEFWPSIKDGGIFLIEDLHTSYWPMYGGTYKKPGTFIEYAKDLIDQLNAWHSKDPALKANQYTRTIRGMHVYDSVIVFDKGKGKKPTSKKTGQLSF